MLLLGFLPCKQSQEEQYNLLLALQTEMVSFIKDGVVARDVYQHALSFVADKKPELEKHFVKNVGFGVSSSQPSIIFLN